MSLGLPPGFCLRGFEPDDLPTLLAIEHQATALLASHGHQELCDLPPMTLVELEVLLAGKGVWIAARQNDNCAVGFADCRTLPFWAISQPNFFSKNQIIPIQVEAEWR